MLIKFLTHTDSRITRHPLTTVYHYLWCWPETRAWHLSFSLPDKVRESSKLVLSVSAAPFLPRRANETSRGCGEMVTSCLWKFMVVYVSILFPIKWKITWAWRLQINVLPHWLRRTATLQANLCIYGNLQMILSSLICVTFQRAWNVFHHRRKNALVCFWDDVWFWEISIWCLAFDWHSLTSPICHIMHRISLDTWHIIKCMPSACGGHQTRKGLYSH